MESSLNELRTQLTYAELRAEESLRLEGIVGDKFKNGQKQITNNCLSLVSSLRIRVQDRINNPLPLGLDQ